MPVVTAITNTEITLGIIAFILNTYLGLAVYMKNPKSWTNRLFFILVLVLDAYIVVNPVSLHPLSPTPEGQLLWIRIVMFFAALMGPLLFLLAHTFPQSRISLRPLYLAGTLLIMALTAGAALSDLVYKSISYPAGNPVPAPGIGMPFFFFDFAGFILLAFAIIIGKYRAAEGAEKIRIKYFLGGIIGTFTLMTLATVFSVVVFETASLVFLGPIFPVILMTFLAYAIARHHFLDIRPIIARGVSFIILLLLLAGFYSAALLLVVNRFIPIDLNLLLIFQTLLAIIAISFHFLERIVRRITNRIFFTAYYDSDVLLSRVTHIMAETIELGDLTKQLLETLTTEMNISKGAFLVIENHAITNVLGIGYADHRSSIPELEKLFHETTALHSYFLFEDLEEGSLKELFRTLDVSIAIPVKVETSEVALLILGQKKSGEIYYERDISFLSTFASEAGIAIQNALAYEKIKKFSQELEQLVEERTKELRETQERELAKARDVARLKDEFVFIAAHELRTPVTAIRGFLELMSTSEKRSPKQLHEYLDAISRASENLGNLINDLLEIARSDADTMKVETKPVALSKIILSVVRELKPLAKKHHVRFIVRAGTSTSWVSADAEKLEEVIMNLVSNAIKYNKRDGFVEISITSKKPNLAVVQVKDTGYGIPKEDQEKIFQKFFRAKTPATQSVLGTGLGLFIARMLIERMGGTITFASTEGKGSTFTFSLPKARVQTTKKERGALVLP